MCVCVCVCVCDLQSLHTIVLFASPRPHLALWYRPSVIEGRYHFEQVICQFAMSDLAEESHLLIDGREIKKRNWCHTLFSSCYAFFYIGLFVISIVFLIYFAIVNNHLNGCVLDGKNEDTFEKSSLCSFTQYGEISQLLLLSLLVILSFGKAILRKRNTWLVLFILY